MANLSLRSYYQEIESLIEEKRFDEATAHCRHILQTFPKCIDAYRLLGKTFLEAKRYGDAADIFQRVLSTIPDDAIAHVGMSVVREDEGNLDEAIWHLESAYEVQPSNPAIQEELRRLYGRRDGDQPAKIRLSRGALARMYVRGELFPQAIADIRSAMAEDPDRIDLQILLADIYSRTGKNADAVDQARQVLQKLPNSYEANRLLALLLADSERAEDARAYLQLITELNPYAAHLVSLADPIDQASDEAVALTRLEWTPAQAGEAKQEISGDVPKALVEEGEEIPEWMQDAGWNPAEETAASKNFAIDEPLEAAGDLARADLPDWLQDLTPSGVAAPEVQPDISADGESDEDVLPWLDKLFSAKVEEPAGDFLEPEAAQTPGETWAIEASEPDTELAAEIPDWLTGSAKAPELSGEGELDAELAAEIPDWLAGSAKEPELSDEGGFDAELAAEIPDWLAGSAKAPELSDEGGLDAELAAEIPDWLAGSAKAPELSDEGELDAELAAEIPDWLSGSTKEPELSDEGGLDAELAAEIPDWLTNSMNEPEAEEWDAEKAQAISQWLSSSETEPGDESDLQAEKIDETPDWLSTPAGLTAEVEDTLAKLAEDTPDWLTSAKDEEPQAELAVDTPDWLTPAEDEEPLAELAGDTPDWLTPAEDEEPLAELAGDTPDWLSGSAQEPELSGESEPDAVLAAEIPDWLKPVELEENQHSELTGDTPDWLSQIEEPAITLDDTRPSIRTRSILETPAEPIPTSEEFLFGQDEVETLVGTPALEEAEPVAEQAGAYDEASVSMDEEDAAFAWLESLAVKQGADEALLLTPEERVEQAPEWVTAAQETAEPELPFVAAVEEVFEAEAPVELEAPAAVEEIFEAAAPAELEAAAAVEEIFEAEAPVELEAPAAVEEIFEAEAPVELEAPAAVEEIFEAEAPMEFEAPAAVEEGFEAEAPMELEAPAIVDEFAEEAALDVEAAEEAIPELPDWLAGAEPTTAEPLEWSPPTTRPVQPVDLNQASLAELERLPGVGFRLAQQIVDFRAEHGPFQQLSDLNQVAGAEDLNLEDLDGFLLLPEVSEISQPETTPAFAPLVGEETQLSGIDAARQAINRSELDLATSLYAGLVSSEGFAPAVKQEILRDVLQDLQEAVKYHPEHFGLWQTLGDAYMRTDQVKPALEAYFTAEKLLR